MITTASPTHDAPSARSLPVFSNFTRCASCRRTSEIRVHYCPGCTDVSGENFHRICRCGATWLERSAGHVGVDISLDDPAFVAICRRRPEDAARDRATAHDAGLAARFAGLATGVRR